MPVPPLILGISAYYHDAAAALVRDGQIVAAAQEERLIPVWNPTTMSWAIEFVGRNDRL